MHRIVEVLCVDVFVLIRSSGDIFYARALLLVSIRRRRIYLYGYFLSFAFALDESVFEQDGCRVF